jgi:hypothetical protein
VETKCLICGFISKKTISNHVVQKHNISKKEYYDRFLKKENEGICKLEGCLCSTTFVGVNRGYLKHCCNSHGQKDKETRDKINNTILERYNRTNPFDVEKSQKTKLKKYGNKNYNSPQKTRDALLNRTEEEKEVWRKKVRKKWKSKTPDEKYRIYLSGKETAIERGTYFSILEHMKEKYNIENPSQLDSIKEKVRNTIKNRTQEEKDIINGKTRASMLKKYGVAHIMHLEEMKKLIIEKSQKAKIKNGTVLPPEQAELFVKYKTKVYALTNSTRKKKFNEEELIKIGRCGVEGALQTDHKLSLKDGFLNGVLPWIMAHPCNLKLVPWEENDRKKDRSEITVNELLNDISDYYTRLKKMEEECKK